jgi:hypothetical protein
VELIALGSRLDPAMISSTPAAKSGGVFTAWELAEEYGFTGSDGAAQPGSPLRHVGEGVARGRDRD